MMQPVEMGHAKRRRSAWPIRVPEGWRVVRRSGTFLYDSLVPIAFVLLGLVTLGLIAFAAGVLLGLIPYT
ncbi:MAG: hypothetical protein HY688_03910 [Chloroflexi bacterium]|nr:hypothetical protein [Chloroflexota bacterium]